MLSLSSKQQLSPSNHKSNNSSFYSIRNRSQQMSSPSSLRSTEFQSDDIVRAVSATSEMTSTQFESRNSSSLFRQQTIRDNRERETKQLAMLNDQLSSHIEKVFFIEAHNRKLEEDLADMRMSDWTEVVAQTYQEQKVESKKKITNFNRIKLQNEKELKRLEIELRRLIRTYKTVLYQREAEVENVRTHIVEMKQKQKNNKRPCFLFSVCNCSNRMHGFSKDKLRLLVELYAIEIGRLRIDNRRIVDELKRTRRAIAEEISMRIRNQKQVTALEMEIETEMAVHREEVRVITSMSSGADTASSQSSREYFRQELMQAICDIRSEYEQNRINVYTEMYSEYQLKLEQIQLQSSQQLDMKIERLVEVKNIRQEFDHLRWQLDEFERRNLQLNHQIKDLNYQYADEQRIYELAIDERMISIRQTRNECAVLVDELKMLIDRKETIEAEIEHYRRLTSDVENRIRPMWTK